jgi:excisionase family DNA binding protein
MEEKRFLDVQELTDYIHMSESYVYKMVSKNSIPHIKLGTRTLFERNQIDAWVINGGRIGESLPPLPKV